MAKTPADYARLSVPFDPEVKERIDQAAKQHGTTASSMVKAMVADALPIWEKFTRGPASKAA